MSYDHYLNALTLQLQTSSSNASYYKASRLRNVPPIPVLIPAEDYFDTLSNISSLSEGKSFPLAHCAETQSTENKNCSIQVKSDEII